MNWNALLNTATKSGVSGLIESLTVPFKRLLYGEDWYQSQIGNKLSGAQNQQNEFNALEAEKNRQFNSIEAEMARQFNADEAAKNRQFQLDFYNNFQSPKAMVEQAQAAGINPAVMFGGITTPSGASGSSASGPAASGSPASSGGASIGSVGIGSLLDLAMQMRKLDIEEKVADSEVTKNEASAGLTSAQTTEQLLKNGYTDAIQALTVEEKRSEIEKNISQASVNRSTVEVNGQRIPLLQEQLTQTQAETQYLQARTILEHIDADKAKMSLEYMREVTEAELALTNAKTQEAYASAARHYSETALNALEHMKEDKLITQGFYDSQVDMIKQQVEHENWDTLQAKRDYKWTPVKNVFGILRDTGLALGGVATAVKTFTPAGMASSVASGVASKGGFTSSFSRTDIF